MKKTLISSLLLVAFAIPFAPIPAKAQTFSVEQQVTLDALRQQIIDLLIQQIAMLQAKIDEIIAKQAMVQEPVYQTTQLGSQEIPLKFSAYLTQVPTYWASIKNGQSISDENNYQRVSVASNKTLDPSKTEVFVNGVKRDVNVSNVIVSGENVSFDLSPMLPQFMVLANDSNLPSNTRTGVYRVRFHFTDGTSITTKESRAYQFPDKTGFGGEGNIDLGL